MKRMKTITLVCDSLKERVRAWNKVLRRHEWVATGRTCAEVFPHLSGKMLEFELGKAVSIAPDVGLWLDACGYLEWGAGFAAKGDPLRRVGRNGTLLLNQQ